MKKLFVITLSFLMIACSEESTELDETSKNTVDDFNPVYLAENGITIKAKDLAEIGAKGMVNGVEYTIVDNDMFRDMLDTDDGGIVKDVTTVCTSRITDMNYNDEVEDGSIFPYDFNQDISTWDVSNVTNMGQMFHRTYIFNQDLSAWDVSNVTKMRMMFGSAQNFNQDLSAWDVSNVTDMTLMFLHTQNFNQDLSAWDVSNVTSMGAMFYGAWRFNQDLSAWDVSNVTGMSSMFRVANRFNQDLSAWDVSEVTDMQWMFYDASAFNQDLSAWDVSNVKSCVDFYDFNPSWIEPKPNFTNCDPN